MALLSILLTFFFVCKESEMGKYLSQNTLESTATGGGDGDGSTR